MASNNLLSIDQTAALQSLGYLYLQHGQLGRGLALTILADRSRPAEVNTMRTLAYAYLKNKEPLKALQVIEQIQTIIPAIDPASPLQLLKAQALWLAGEKERARRTFRHYLAARDAAQQRTDQGMDELLLGADDDVLELGSGDRM